MGKKPSKLKRACLRCWPVLRFRVVGRGVARWKRYCVRALIGLPLVFVATVVIVTQTPIMGNLLLPRMSAAIGMEIKAGRVYVARDGRLILLDVEVLVGDELYIISDNGIARCLDAKTGKLVWETQIADYRQGYSNSAGPIVVDGKVINAINGCARFQPDSCFITAHDARTGEELWRTLTIAQPGSPGGDTWGDLSLTLRGGGDSWIAGSYDPELGLIYWPVAQAKPWVPATRGLTVHDAALYTNATLALDPDDGSITWYFQHVPGEALDLDEAAWDRVLDTNLKGAWLVAREVARHMVRLGHGGSIINIASVAGLVAVKQLAAYCASKAGLIQLTRALAIELAPHDIRVNAIAPGYIETDMNREFLAGAEGRRLIDRIPQRRAGEPSDLDGLLLLLASDASRYMTGAVTTIDGGFSLV